MALKVLEREQNKMPQLRRELDKRYFPRWEANRRVDYNIEAGTVFRAYTRDMSLDGASLLVYGDAPLRDRVRLKIHLADKANFEARCRVVWSREESTHKLLGIVFEKLKPKARALILNYAFELEVFRAEGTAGFIVSK